MLERGTYGVLTLAEILGPVEERILDHRQGGGRRHRRVPVPVHRRSRTRSFELSVDKVHA
jgi:hypothetical protein